MPHLDDTLGYPITEQHVNLTDDDDEDGYGQQQDVKLKVSFLMIPNGMQPPCPVATISVGNRRPSAQKNPRALASARFKWLCC